MNELENQLLKELVLLNWKVPENISVNLINISENKTFEIKSSQGFRAILRVNRSGYRTVNQIRGELDWMEELHRQNIIRVPNILPGRNGKRIQFGNTSSNKQNSLLMFEFIEGYTPQEEDLSNEHFFQLGIIAATLHSQVFHWKNAKAINRDHWILDTILGSTPTWGHWQDAPNLTVEINTILKKTEKLVKQKISKYHLECSEYGLIHADMRLANIIIDYNNSNYTLIDFDDCGFSWFFYDFAASLSFLELHEKKDDFQESWINGYKSVRTIHSKDIKMLDTFVMLRRLALLAWVGSHLESDEPKKLSKIFAKESAILGEKYLTNHS